MGKNKSGSLKRTGCFLAGMILGSVITYLFGTAWLTFQMNLTFVQGLFTGVIPYLPGDALKIVTAVKSGELPLLVTALGTLQNLTSAEMDIDMQICFNPAEE